MFEHTIQDHVNNSQSIDKSSKSVERGPNKVLLGLKKVPTEASTIKDQKLELKRNQKNSAILLRPQTANVQNSKRYLKRDKSNRSENSQGKY